MPRSKQSVTETEKNFSANQRVFITSMLSMNASDDAVIESVKSKFKYDIDQSMIDQYKIDEEKAIIRERKKIGIKPSTDNEVDNVVTRAAALLNKRLNRGIADQAELESISRQYAKGDIGIDEYVRQKSLLLEIPTTELLKIMDALTPKPEPAGRAGKKANEASMPDSSEPPAETMSPEQIKELSDAIAKGDAIQIQKIMYPKK